MTYPVWRYHKDKPEGKIVYSEAEDKELGAGWVDSPAKFSDEKPAESYREHMAKWESKEEKVEVAEKLLAEMTLEELAAECKKRGIHHKKYMGKPANVMIALLEAEA